MFWLVTALVSAGVCGFSALTALHRIGGTVEQAFQRAPELAYPLNAPSCCPEPPSGTPLIMTRRKRRASLGAPDRRRDDDDTDGEPAVPGRRFRRSDRRASSLHEEVIARKRRDWLVERPSSLA